MLRAILLERHHQRTFIPIDVIDNGQDYIKLVSVTSKILQKIWAITEDK